MFVWGTGRGGQRWQDFLSEPGNPYIEIQAGLARTQMETIPMPADSELNWLEAYGLVEADQEKVHGKDWNLAVGEVERYLDTAIPETMFRKASALAEEISPMAPFRLLQKGSGWGALELKRLQIEGKKSFTDASMPFPESSMTSLQTPWLRLLETGEFESVEENLKPDWVVQEEWSELLEHASNDNYYRRLHLGVICYNVDDKVTAEAHWHKSLAMRENIAACRNLAVLYAAEGEHGDAADFWLRAMKLLPNNLELIVESEKSFLSSGRAEELLAVILMLPADKLAVGRVRLLMIHLYLEINELDRAKELFENEFETNDLREGENTLSELWTQLSVKRLAGNSPVTPEILERAKRKFPIPRWLNFNSA